MRSVFSSHVLTILDCLVERCTAGMSRCALALGGVTSWAAAVVLLLLVLFVCLLLFVFGPVLYAMINHYM